MTNKEIIEKLEIGHYLLVIRSNGLYNVLDAIYENGDPYIVPRDVIRGWFEREKTYKIAQFLEVIYGPDSLVYFYDDEKLSKEYQQKRKMREDDLEFEKLLAKKNTTNAVEKLKVKNEKDIVGKNPKGRSRLDYIRLSEEQFDELIYLDIDDKKLSNEIGEFMKDQKISNDSTLINMRKEQERIRSKIKYLENINNGILI